MKPLRRVRKFGFKNLKFDMENTRVCKQCEKEYELEVGFYSTGKDGKFHSTCKNCKRESTRLNQKGLKRCMECFEIKPSGEFDIHGETRKRLSMLCIDCLGDLPLGGGEKTSARRTYLRYHMDIRDKQIDSRLMSRYGISLETYNEMLASQDGKCYLCDNTEGNKRPHVDHNHETGKVRGLLCYPCNTKIGVIENKEWMEKAINYLNYFHGIQEFKI
jgi:hypothetical protein